MTDQSDPAEDAHHADNQHRFITIEEKLDANTAMTEKLASDTAELVVMWQDAGVFFKWMRRLGGAIAWVSKVAIAIGTIYGIGHYYGGPK
jgi:hypothetical protein